MWASPVLSHSSVAPESSVMLPGLWCCSTQPSAHQYVHTLVRPHTSTSTHWYVRTLGRPHTRTSAAPLPSRIAPLFLARLRQTRGSLPAKAERCESRAEEASGLSAGRPAWEEAETGSCRPRHRGIARCRLMWEKVPADNPCETVQLQVELQWSFQISVFLPADPQQHSQRWGKLKLLL